MTNSKLNTALLVAACMGVIFSTTPLFAKSLSKSDVQVIVVREAANSVVPPELALAVARVESNFNPNARSSAGARGVMQIMPRTAKGVFGVDRHELWDPKLNIQLGIDYLAQLYHRYGQRWDLALSHYNGGTLRGKGAFAKPHSYTRNYVASVMNWRDRYADQSAIWQYARKPQVLARLDNIDERRDDIREELNRSLNELTRLRNRAYHFDYRDPVFSDYKYQVHKDWRKGTLVNPIEWTSKQLDQHFGPGFAERFRVVKERTENFPRQFSRNKV